MEQIKLNHKEIRQEFFNSVKDDPYRLKIDIDAIHKRHSVVQRLYEKYNNKLTGFYQSIGGKKDTAFNVNSTEHKKLILSHFHLLPASGSCEKKFWENKASGNEVLEDLIKLSSLEIERRCIEGPKKGGGGIFTKISEGGVLTPEITCDDGRVYFQTIYSLPRALRTAVVPFDSNKRLIYIDLSSAELTVLSYLSEDENLQNEILSGRFWEIWYERLGIKPELKEDLKVAIYSLCYSGDIMSVPDSIPSLSFSHKFTTSYPKFWRWIKSIRSQAGISGTVIKGLFDYQEIGSASTPRMANLVTNHLIQFGQASCTIAVSLCLRSVGIQLRTTNFDSFLIEADESEVQHILSALEVAMDYVGYRFRYKYHVGKTYYEAQYGDNKPELDQKEADDYKLEIKSAGELVQNELF